MTREWEQRHCTSRSQLNEAEIFKLLCCLLSKALGPEWHRFPGQLFQNHNSEIHSLKVQTDFTPSVNETHWSKVQQAVERANLFETLYLIHCKTTDARRASTERSIHHFFTQTVDLKDLSAVVTATKVKFNKIQGLIKATLRECNAKWEK